MMHALLAQTSLLVQASPPQIDWSETILWSGGLFVVVVVLAIITARYKKRLFDEDDLSGHVWDLGKLAELRESGEVTEEEYQKLRAQLLRGLGVKRDRPSDGKSTR